MTLAVKKIPDRWRALGLAANFVAKHEPFGRFPAGDLIRTLSAQVQRGHCLFALDTSNDPARVVGYVGWSLYDHAAAERFAATGVPPAEELANGGDVVWVLTAVADTRSGFFALAKAARALYPAHRVMGIRHKRDGRRITFDQWRMRSKDKKIAVSAT
jgi:hemolysin-activating ACP:hemolysin acyltransferase